MPPTDKKMNHYIKRLTKSFTRRAIEGLGPMWSAALISLIMAILSFENIVKLPWPFNTSFWSLMFTITGLFAVIELLLFRLPHTDETFFSIFNGRNQSIVIATVGVISLIYNTFLKHGISGDIDVGKLGKYDLGFKKKSGTSGVCLSSLIGTYTHAPDGTWSVMPRGGTGTGTGMTLAVVTKDATVTGVFVTDYGKFYQVGETLTISGREIGGKLDDTVKVNDITVTLDKNCVTPECLSSLIGTSTNVTDNTYTDVKPEGGSGIGMTLDVDTYHKKVKGLRVTDYGYYYKAGDNLTIKLDESSVEDIITVTLDKNCVTPACMSSLIGTDTKADDDTWPVAPINTGTGTGSGMALVVVTKGGKVTDMRVTTYGENYVVGDTLTILASELTESGSNVNNNSDVVEDIELTIEANYCIGRVSGFVQASSSTETEEFTPF